MPFGYSKNGVSRKLYGTTHSSSRDRYNQQGTIVTQKLMGLLDVQKERKRVDELQATMLSGELCAGLGDQH